MPETRPILRIATASNLIPTPQRVDLSALLGLDLDLVLGTADETPAEEYARLCALADMADAGFIDRGPRLDRLALVAGLAEELDRIESEEDANNDGFDFTEDRVRGAAA